MHVSINISNQTSNLVNIKLIFLDYRGQLQLDVRKLDCYHDHKGTNAIFFVAIGFDIRHNTNRNNNNENIYIVSFVQLVDILFLTLNQLTYIR